ncbi:hypothetical protein AXG93_1998s1040 [Marchantia polymorpha subsp. ruderalis]|uniref:Amino acid transporter transmembrane domain-containing protein n=1 Tax=Marchantia polymorpha subsp. ruderalis TaxID=1480154 RepID=A0A176VMN0_MARPO|nr:hypothetical protein AXG93_1998s1040 [Marchantia polymorpha subsp. ruderalis]
MSCSSACLHSNGRERKYAVNEHSAKEEQFPDSTTDREIDFFETPSVDNGDSRNAHRSNELHSLVGEFSMQMLLLSFTIAIIVYGGLAVMGAVMFGDQTLALITLYFPKDLTVGTVVLWTTVVTPLSKFSLGIAPIALELEGLLPFGFGSKTIVAVGSVIRLGLFFLNCHG